MNLTEMKQTCRFVRFAESVLATQLNWRFNSVQFSSVQFRRLRSSCVKAAEHRRLS